MKKKEKKIIEKILVGVNKEFSMSIIKQQKQNNIKKLSSGKKKENQD